MNRMILQPGGYLCAAPMPGRKSAGGIHEGFVFFVCDRVDINIIFGKMQRALGRLGSKFLASHDEFPRWNQEHFFFVDCADDGIHIMFGSLLHYIF